MALLSEKIAYKWLYICAVMAPCLETSVTVNEFCCCDHEAAPGAHVSAGLIRWSIWFLSPMCFLSSRPLWSLWAADRKCFSPWNLSCTPAPFYHNEIEKKLKWKWLPPSESVHRTGGGKSRGRARGDGKTKVQDRVRLSACSKETTNKKNERRRLFSFCTTASVCNWTHIWIKTSKTNVIWFSHSFNIINIINNALKVVISSHGAVCSFSVGFSAALCDWPLILFTSIKRRPLIDVACLSSSSSIGIPAAHKHINKPCAQRGKHIKAISLPSSGHLWGG